MLSGSARILGGETAKQYPKFLVSLKKLESKLQEFFPKYTALNNRVHSIGFPNWVHRTLGFLETVVRVNQGTKCHWASCLPHFSH